MSAGSARLAADGRTQAGGAWIRWRREGTGPALVLLHGFPLSGRSWDPVIARLRDRFTCYTADLIGLGESRSTAAEDYGSRGQARAIAAVLSQLGVDRYALAGNDTGGWIARELAILDGGRVSHLILTNTEIPHHRPPWIPTYQTLAHVPGFGIALGQMLRFRALRRSGLGFGGCFADLSRLDGDFHHTFVEPLITSAARREGALVFLRQMKFSRLDEFRHLHRQLTIPTLFIWGAEDPTFPVERARAMLPEFANVAGFDAIAQAKLLVHMEQPDEVARRIGEFLVAVRGQAAGP